MTLFASIKKTSLLVFFLTLAAVLFPDLAMAQNPSDTTAYTLEEAQEYAVKKQP